MNYGSNILKMENINFTIGRGKKAFSLNGISFSLPQGSVMGLIGENGAGKTTLIRLILNLYVQDSGSIYLFGHKAERDCIENRDKIGFIIAEQFLPSLHTAKTAGTFLSKFYSNWDSELYLRYLDEFKVPLSKRLFSISSGTLQKLQIAIALSHKAELLIMDEPLNYLDPIFKKQFLELLQNFMKDEKHSIFISSHQTSDLEKICDRILFLKNGQKIFSESMENLTENYGLLKTDEKGFHSLLPNEYDGFRKTKYAYEILTANKSNKKFANMICENAKLEDIMYFYTMKQGEN